ncbi:MAG: DoxX family protein [Pseudomonadota bacterium]
MERLAKFAPQSQALLRIVSALAFMEHGLMKQFSFPAAQPGAPDPLPPILIAAAWLEIVGGALVAVGFQTRLAAFILSGQMAVAYWVAHGTKSFWPALNGGEPALLYCFVFLFLACAGPGAWSVDGLRKR